MIKKFFRFLYWVWWDIRHPLAKKPYGITCYIGLPGTGKTLSLVYELLRLKQEYPKAKIYTNFGFKYEDGAILDWRDLVFLDNGDNGIIFGLDEVHTIWGRFDTQKVPREILELFSQNRKYSKQMVCTSQTYEDIVIDIRRRCHYIIECRNIAARWVFQRAFRPEDYKLKDGEYTPRRRAFRLSFIANNFIYEAYDSYKIIKSIADKVEADTLKKSVEASPTSS